MKLLRLISVFAFSILFISCDKQDSGMKELTDPDAAPPLEERIAAYAPVEISADLSFLSEREKQLVEKLVEAGELADAIFWRQSSSDAIAVRDSLSKLNDAESKKLLEYVKINYGPYDVIYGNNRFVGKGPETRPDGDHYYPEGMTKDDFEKFIKENPDQKKDLEGQYTVVRKEDGKLKAIPFHKAYPEVEQLAKKLDEAADLADNPTLKNYLKLRAKAVRTDDYFESDMAWMDLKNSNIDLVIGPIENYQDALYNYKTAYEAVIMVKDVAASEELEMFRKHINDFEQRLPYDKKYIRKSAGEDNILQVVNVVYFGGDCQKGTKTIAASLPNDPKVHELKGGKKSMYKNMMEAKFDKIVMPISKILLTPEMQKYVDKKAFTSFVTLHEVSHTLGRGYVYGNDSLPVRKALEEKYSAIEETKADIVGLYNMKHLKDMGEINDEDIKKAISTFVAGLYRSIRFGGESAHGNANMIQLNWLKSYGALVKDKTGKYSVNEPKFWEAVKGLANRVLTLQAKGDKAEAERLIKEYGKMSDETKKEIELLKNIPRDINTSYPYLNSRRS